MTLWMPGGFQGRGALDAAGGGGGGPTVTLDQLSASGGSHSNATVTTYTGGLLNITGGLTKPALVASVCVMNNVSITGLTSVWDLAGANQSMTSLGSVTGGSAGLQIFFFGLRNPTSGNHQVTLNWTNSSQVGLCTASFYNVDQTSDAAAFTNFNSATGANPPAVTITSAANDYVAAAFNAGANFTATSGTLWFIDNNGNASATAGCIAAGSGSVAMTSTGGNASSVAAGINIHAG